MLVSLWFWLGWWRKKKLLLTNRWLLRTIAVCGPAGFLALEAGWIVTEVGRQPWVINGIMKTRDAVTTGHGVPAMFFLFTSLYLVLTATVAIYLWRLSHAPRALAPQEAYA
jgi:cytochrome d ubiquinol oxidase subunit I